MAHANETNVIGCPKTAVPASEVSPCAHHPSRSAHHVAGRSGSGFNDVGAAFASSTAYVRGGSASSNATDFTIGGGGPYEISDFRSENCGKFLTGPNTIAATQVLLQGCLVNPADRPLADERSSVFVIGVGVFQFVRTPSTKDCRVRQSSPLSTIVARKR